MGASSLSEFQRAAVDHIVARLSDGGGSQRFLLADEVGLGKTIVAREVIARLAKRHRGGAFNVVYLCSNGEIAEQNRKKLVADIKAEERAYRRITELAFKPSTAPRVCLFAFTPGTSLQSSTGVAWERKLIVYLVRRVLRHEGIKFSRYFCCGVDPEKWDHETKPKKLSALFNGETSSGFRKMLRAAWKDASVDWEGETPIDLVRDFADIVVEYDRNRSDPELRSKRNAVVRALRTGLQSAALESMKPHLVILDEVQRFREILNLEADESSLEARLFAKRGTRVLLLSATPYQLYTQNHEAAAEDVSHYDDFLATLAFLFHPDRGDGALDQIKSALSRYRALLADGRFLRMDDPALRQTKATIEGLLKRVLCRTERNWYVQDVGKGVEAVGLSEAAERSMPPEELADYVRLRGVAVDDVDSSQNLMEYWKSCPAVLTFMDHGYKLCSNIDQSRRTLAPELIATGRELEALPERSYRFRALMRATFEDAPEGTWPWLWMKPSYAYYENEFYARGEPRKLLVFSSWRFVPKAIAILLSGAAAKRVGEPMGEGQPLRFGTSAGKLAFHPFDVLFPSTVLAEAVPLSSWATRGLTADAVFDEARTRIRALLAARGVQLRETKSAPLWEIIGFLEGRASSAPAVRVVLDEMSVPARHGTDDVAAFEPYRERWLEWMDATMAPSIAEAQVERLTEIAVFSPGISLLRALWSAFPSQEGVLPPELAAVCFTGLRSYFNRPTVRAIVDAYGRAKATPNYTGRVLGYCRDAHLQAVLDEYVFLLGESVGEGRIDELFETLSRIFGIAPGAPKTNAKQRRGDVFRIDTDGTSHATSFALTFGDESAHAEDADEPAAAGKTGRKTAVREAFNSPFWPFVLATTSKGQEGLDFHFYCRDVVHWNLPWNPVDLEQREGRINRRNGLSVRRSIAADWPLARVSAAEGGVESSSAYWPRVFGAVAASDDLQRYKHGMFPHWIYECANSKDTARIRRHLPFHPLSEDAARFRRLKEEVALYRLVFGQPRQEDLLEHLRHEIAIEGGGAEAIQNRLAGYMINLSPLPADHARSLARSEAGSVLNAPDANLRLEGVVRQVTELRTRHASALGAVSMELDVLVAVIDAHLSGDVQEEDALRASLEALLYLRNPYDDVFDFSDSGFADDIAQIRVAHARISAKARPSARRRWSAQTARQRRRSLSRRTG